MKKYFLGLTAVVCALAFSAFTKPFTMLEFKLKQNPVSSGIVSNDAKWTTAGTGHLYGDCAGSTQDLACTVSLDDSRSSYYHTESGEVIFNTKAYADANNVDYIEIIETTGLLSGGVQDYKISSIQAKQNDGNDNYSNVSLGANLSFVNSQEIGRASCRERV